MSLLKAITQRWRQKGGAPLPNLGTQMEDARQELLVGSALEVGIFSALDNRALSAAGMASSLGLDERAAWTVAEALVESGYLTKAGDVYSLTTRSKELFIASSSSTYVADELMHYYHQLQRWLRLPQILRGRQPPEIRTRYRPGECSVRAWGKWASMKAPTVVRKCLRRAPLAKTVLDLGGGQGTYAKEFARRGLKVTLFDLPEVIEIATPDLAGIQGIMLVSGDFQQMLPAGPFDIVFLGNVCHLYGPEENIVLFSRVRSILSPKGLLAILDFARDHSPIGSRFALNMLVNTRSGGTWTEAEYSRWLDQSGFGVVEMHDIDRRRWQLILAEKGVS